VPDLRLPRCLAMYINGLVQCKISGAQIATFPWDKPFFPVLTGSSAAFLGLAQTGLATKYDRLNEKTALIWESDPKPYKLSCSGPLSPSLETLDATIRHDKPDSHNFAAKREVPGPACH
jgi:hypothetical protein